MVTGIIGAMAAEVELFLQSVDISDTVQKSAFEYHRGEYKGRPVVMTRCGVGKVAAAVCTQVLISEFGVGRVIFTGIGGAVSSDLDVGDIVVSKDTIQHDFDVTLFGRQFGEVPPPGRRVVEADPELRRLAVEAASRVDFDGHSPRVVEGRILTGDQFISSGDKVIWLNEVYQGHVAEMEGAAVAQTCDWNGVPFVIVRAVSDAADGDARYAYDRFMKIVARNSASIVLNMLEHAEP